MVGSGLAKQQSRVPSGKKKPSFTFYPVHRSVVNMPLSNPFIMQEAMKMCDKANETEKKDLTSNQIHEMHLKMSSRGLKDNTQPTKVDKEAGKGE